MLLAQALRDARRPVVVHPQFTEPEAALRAAGHRVDRVLLDADDGFRLDPRAGAGRRRPGPARQPDQPDVGAAPGRDRRRARPAGPGAGRRRGVRRHQCPGEPASRSRWPPGATCPASWWCAASPRPGAWPGCGSATCSAPADLLARLAAGQPLWAGLHPGARRRGRLRLARSPSRPSAQIAAALAADRDHLVARGCGAARAYASPARRPAPSCCSTCAGAARVRLRAARAGLRGPPGRHLPGPGPGLAAGRGAGHCHAPTRSSTACRHPGGP